MTRTIIDSDLEKNASDSSIINISEMGEIFNVDQIPIVETIILFLIGIGGSVILIGVKNKKFELLQRHDWNSTQKEQVRNRQYEKCNMCFTQPSQWKYDHVNGDKNNNELNNCQGLCPDCLSVKIDRENRIIYRK